MRRKGAEEKEFLTLLFFAHAYSKTSRSDGPPHVYIPVFVSFTVTHNYHYCQHDPNSPHKQERCKLPMRLHVTTTASIITITILPTHSIHLLYKIHNNSEQQSKQHHALIEAEQNRSTTNTHHQS